MISFENVILSFAYRDLLTFRWNLRSILQSINELMTSFFEMLLPQDTILLDLSLTSKVQILHLLDSHASVLLYPIFWSEPLFRHKYNKSIDDAARLDIEQVQEQIFTMKDKELAMSRGNRRLKLKGQEYEATVTLNWENKSLDIVSKHYQDKEQFWGSFTIQDLQTSLQVLLDSISGLYDYICQNSEEVEIQKDKVIIRLNFLKQTKEIELKLHPMLMFSHDQHEKLTKRIQSLEQEVRALKGREQGCRKLTMQFTQKTVNLNNYSFVDLSEARPYNKLNQLSILRICPENTLPQTGIWSFTLYPTSFHQYEALLDKNILKEKGKESPYLEIGVRNDDGQKEVIKLLAFQNELFFSSEEQQGFVKEKHMLKVFINLGCRKLVVMRCFQRGERIMEWKQFKKTDRLWLILTAFRMNIQTDLFVDEQCVDWNKPQQLTPSAEQ